jgi:O-antigen/teichoic acid export membrane protein
VIRQLLRDSAIYLLPNLLARGIGLILLPVYTRYLSPTDYGVVELLAVLYALLNVVLPLEISQAVARFSADAKHNVEKSRLVSTAFWFTALAFAIWFTVSVLFPLELSRAILGVEGDRYLLPTAAAAMLANALLYLAMNQLRWNLQQIPYLVVSVLFAITTATVSVTLIVGFSFGVYGMIWGQLAGSAAALIAGAAYLAGTSPIVARFSIAQFKAQLKFSAPLVLSSLAIYFTTYTDRWLVSIWMGLDGVGVYSVALRIASVLAVATSSVQLALTPLIYSRYREVDTPDAIRKFFQYYLFGAFSLVVVVGVFAAEIIKLVAGPRFQDAHEIVAPVMLATLILSLNVFCPGLSLAKRTGRLAVANVIGGAVNIAASLWLIPVLGLIGAAMSNLIASSLIMVLRFAWSQQHYFIPYRWSRYALTFAILSLVLWLAASQSLPAYGRLALTLAGIASFALLLTGRDDHARAVGRGQGA